MELLKFRKNEQGVSLVEVLAVITLLGIIIVLVVGILSSGQKQYHAQSEKNQSHRNISYALKVLTKEIRQSPDNIIINSPNEIEIAGVTYKQSGTNLMKASTILVTNISLFEVTESSNTIHIKIVSSTGEEVSTQIVKRS